MLLLAHLCSWNTAGCITMYCLVHIGDLVIITTQLNLIGKGFQEAYWTKIYDSLKSHRCSWHVYSKTRNYDYRINPPKKKLFLPLSVAINFPKVFVSWKISFGQKSSMKKSTSRSEHSPRIITSLNLLPESMIGPSQCRSIFRWLTSRAMFEG